jgi:hypothetical protein
VKCWTLLALVQEQSYSRQAMPFQLELAATDAEIIRDRKTLDLLSHSVQVRYILDDYVRRVGSCIISLDER